MSDYSVTRDAPRSPPTHNIPSYIPYPSDLDTRDGIPRSRGSFFSHRTLPSQAQSTQSWVNSNLLSPPLPPPDPFPVSTPAYGGRPLPDIRESVPFSFSQDEEYMNIDPNAIEEPEYGWTAGYPGYSEHRQQQGYYEEAQQAGPMQSPETMGRKEGKKKFVGGFFSGFKRLNVLRKGKKGKQRTADALPAVEEQEPSALYAGPTPPQYSSNPPTPVTPIDPANVQYVEASEMPIPETESPPIDSRSRHNESLSSRISRRPTPNLNIIPPSEGSNETPRPSRSESWRTRASDRPPPSRHQSEERHGSRQPSNHSDSNGTPTHVSPEAVTVEPLPAADYKGMTVPVTVSGYSDPSIGEHFNRVHKFLKDVSGLPWMSRDRITFDYLPGSRGRGGKPSRVRRGGKVILNPVPDKPAKSWYMQPNVHHSVDLLSNGTPSASSAMSPTASSGSSRMYSPLRRRASLEEVISPTSHHRTQNNYQPHAPSYPSPHESRDSHRRRDEHSPRRASPRRHHHHHDSHHRRHAQPVIPPVPTLAYQQPSYPQTYIHYASPVSQPQLIYSSPPPPQPFFFVQSRPGSGENGTPVPTAIRLGSPDMRQFSHPPQNQPEETHAEQRQPLAPDPRPQLQQPTPQSMQQATPVYVVRSPTYVSAPPPLPNIAMPGQYAYPYSPVLAQPLSNVHPQ